MNFKLKTWIENDGVVSPKKVVTMEADSLIILQDYIALLEIVHYEIIEI